MPIGFCVVAIVGQFTTLSDDTAELTIPLVTGFAVAGLVLAWPLRQRGFDGWALVAAAAAFLIYGAPVLLSGDVTIAGYIRLDDTASWLALTERAMEEGSNISGLQPSTYEATLDFYLNSDYPLGGLIPLGVGGELVGQDYAWIWQPYLSFLGALVALGLYALLAELGTSPRSSAALAVVAAQPALLIGFAFWGGFKEVAAAALVLTVAILVVQALSNGWRGRQLLPLAVASAGVLSVLSVGGGMWLAPMLVALVVVWRRASVSESIRNAAWIGACIAVLSVPTILAIGFFGAPAASTITDEERLANLIQPLSLLQAFGIWPAGDFRLRPDEHAATHILIAGAALAVVVGSLWAWRRRHWSILLYSAGLLVSCGATLFLGSHWVDAKALAITAPALVLLALLGAVRLYRAGRLLEAGTLAVVVVGGIVWSNVLAYHTANLAPAKRMAELEEIGRRIDGRGPTLMTEYEPLAARYFLRDGDPESAGELRRRPIHLRDGGTVLKAQYADIDQFELSELLVYRTLVLRRSPTASRPPAVYRLAMRGRYYDVWERPPEATETTLEHLPLGDAQQAGGVPECRVVRELIERGGGNLVAAVPRAEALVADLTEAERPATWVPDPRLAGAVHVSEPGTARTTFSVRAPGRYEVWLGGEVRGEAAIDVAGRGVGAVRHSLSYPEGYTLVGSVDLPAGDHEANIEYGGGDLHPGSGGTPEGMGPLVLSVAGEQAEPILVGPKRAEGLCGQNLDWLEIVR